MCTFIKFSPFDTIFLPLLFFSRFLLFLHIDLLQMATWEEYLANEENINGVRFTWNIMPHSRIDSQRLVVPNVAFFTPLKVRSSLYFSIIRFFKERPQDQPQQPPLEYDPVLCQKASCKAVLNALW